MLLLAPRHSSSRLPRANVHTDALAALRTLPSVRRAWRACAPAPPTGQLGAWKDVMGAYIRSREFADEVARLQAQEARCALLCAYCVLAAPRAATGLGFSAPRSGVHL